MCQYSFYTEFLWMVYIAVSKDPVLEIGFNKNGLYDIGQEQGYGVTQTSWIGASNLSVFDVSV